MWKYRGCSVLSLSVVVGAGCRGGASTVRRELPDRGAGEGATRTIRRDLFERRPQWQQRAQRIREGILQGAELLPHAEEMPVEPDPSQPTRARRLHRRERGLREPAGRVRHGQPVPADEGHGAVRGGSVSARPLERSCRLRPVPARYAEAMRHVRPHGGDCLRVRHGRLRRLGQRRLGPSSGEGLQAPALEQHSRGGLSHLAEGRRSQADRRHRRLGRRDPDPSC